MVSSKFKVQSQEAENSLGRSLNLDTSKSILGECLAQIGKFEETRNSNFPISYEKLSKKLGGKHEQVQNARNRVEQFQKPLSN